MILYLNQVIITKIFSNLTGEFLMKKLLTILGFVLIAALLMPPIEANAQTAILTSPASGSEFVVNTTNSATLYYSFSGGYQISYYWLQVDNNSDFSSPIYNSSSLTATSHTVNSGLENGVTYYWRVAVGYYNSGWKWTAWSSTRTFGFFIPRLQSPSSGSTNRFQPLTLSWMAVLYESSTKVTKRQQLQIDDDPSFGSPISVSSLNNSYTTSALNYNTKYYWRVRYYSSLGFITTYHNWSSIYNFTTGCDGGPAPALVSPANGASGLAQPINLDWSAATNASNYGIQISKNTSFSPTVVNTSTSATNYEASGLEDGTTYYWRVGSYECTWGSYSGYRSFTTVCPEPAPPVLTSPANGATGLSMPFTLDWNDVATAINYGVQIDDNSNFGSPEIYEYPSSSEYQVASGLTDGVQYYWRVYTHDECGNSIWGPSRSFTLECPIPAIPTLELPPNGVTDMSQPVTLDWADVPGATKYHYQIDDSPGFGSINLSNDNVPTSNVGVSGLQNATQYYWRVRSGNLCGWSGWSDVRNFTTDCPVLGPPALTLPANNEDGLDVREQVMLYWGSVGGATDYNVQVADDAGFSSIVAEHVHTSSGYTIQYPLQMGTWYYWRVRTNNACGAGGWSTVRRFQPNCPAVGIANLESPSNGAISITQPIELDWSDVAEATRYDIQVDDNIDFGTMDVNNENVVVSEYTLPTLLEGVTYNWRVRVHNGCQWGDWSSVWNFVAGEQTDIDIIARDEIPEDFKLKHNYPNPFNPSTTIEFALPRASYVTLEIHNILGAKVETLVSRSMSAGSYSVIWDASSVPSGVYFYKIEAGDFFQTKKMTLIK